MTYGVAIGYVEAAPLALQKCILQTAPKGHFNVAWGNRPMDAR